MFKKEFTLKNLVFKDYKDKHKNERVFLLGNGPSLAATDLNLLKNENTEGVMAGVMEEAQEAEASKGANIPEE